MEFGFRLRIGVPASVAGVAIGILFAIFEVQAWKVPAPVALFFLAIVVTIIVVALIVAFYELTREVRRFLEHRATTPSWVSPHEPGLLDYEPDGLRASARFGKEMTGLGRDTRKLGRILNRHTALIENDPTLRSHAKRKQKLANSVAKSIDKSATYMEKRHELMKALVKDIARNYSGIISAVSIHTQGDYVAFQSLMDTLAANIEVANTTTEQVRGYRDSVQFVHNQNLSRTVRLASKRLAESLDGVVVTLQQFSKSSKKLRDLIDDRLRQSSQLSPEQAETLLSASR